MVSSLQFELNDLNEQETFYMVIVRNQFSSFKTNNLYGSISFTIGNFHPTHQLFK